MSAIIEAKPGKIAYDFRPLVKKLERHEITRHEYEEVFRKKRLENNRLGASTAPIIMGISNYGTAESEYAKRRHLYKLVDTEGEEIKWPFELGHMAEDMVRETFSLKTGFKATRCDIAYTNDNWPFLFVNPDGFVYEVDPKTGEITLCLLEIKTTYMMKSEHAELFRKGIVPEDYVVQVQVQLETCNLDRCYLVYAWGWEDFKQRHFIIERDRPYAVEICDAMAEFHTWLETGIRPSGLHASNVRGIMAANTLLYPFGDKKLPKKKLSKETMGRLLTMEKLEQTKKEKDAELKALPLKMEISNLEKEIQELKGLISAEMGDATLGEIKDSDGNAFLVRWKASEEPSFDAKNKKYLKENYPDAWDEMVRRAPKARKFEYERLGINE